MNERPDITIPEEAIVAACNAYEAAVLGVGHEDSDDLANHEEIAAVRAAAPLIVAAALSEMADQIDVRGVDDASAHLRARAAELRGGTQ
jgi:hypothetical protein